MVEFYSSQPKSLVENKNKEFNINDQKCRFHGTEYIYTAKKLVEDHQLSSFEKILDDLDLDYDEIWLAVTRKK